MSNTSNATATPPPTEAIGPALRRTRRKLQVKQTEVAQTLGITTAYLWRLESERAVPSPELAAKIWELVDWTDRNIRSDHSSAKANTQARCQRCGNLLQKESGFTFCPTCAWEPGVSVTKYEPLRMA